MHRKSLFVLIGLVFFVLSMNLVLANEIQLACLDEGQTVDFSKCNPVYEDRTCGNGSSCNYCVTYNAERGVYCPANMNTCNLIEGLSCSSLVGGVEENTEEIINESDNNGTEIEEIVIIGNTEEIINELREVKADVAYLVKNQNGVDDFLLGELDNYGYSYEIIFEENISTVDFYDYYIILVGNQKLSNPQSVPVHLYKSIVINSFNYYVKVDNDQFGWSSSSGISSSPTLLTVRDSVHPVVDDFTVQFLAYDVGNPSIKTSILKGKKPTGIDIIVSSGISGNSVIAAMPVGAEYLNGHVAQERGLFFGITETQFWSSDTRQAFRNSLDWLVDDGDLDGDGFDSNVDCNDRDPNVNPDGEKPFFDCENDPPIIFPSDDLEFFVTDRVEIFVDAVDPENDKLSYKINDDRFEFISNGKIFVWQPSVNDKGDYDVEVSVSDGEFTATDIVKFRVVNNPPEFNLIESLTWEEDSGAELDLNDYFTDVNGDELTYGIDSASEGDNVILVSAENGVFGFSSKENWFGQEWIKFWAFDGESRTESNRVDLFVTNVNDAPFLVKNIEDLTWGEDEGFELDLSRYFVDVDSELEYSVTGDNNVNLEFLGNIAFFSTEKDWFGNDKIVIRAEDEMFRVESNEIILTIEERGEPPEFIGLECQTNINEDEEYSCVLEASDFEGDAFEFSIGLEDNLKCVIEGDNVVYVSEQDYSGRASCELIVADAEHGSSTRKLEVDILAVNDAPEVKGNPEELYLVVAPGQEREFGVIVEDVDSDEYTVEWLLNDLLVGKGDKYLFNEEEGTYIFEASVSDGELKSNRFWNVIVGTTENFICSEVGGNVCSEKQICYGEILNVKDSGSCCSIECSAAPPNFNDAGACREIDDSIKVLVELFDEDEKIELGGIVRAKVEVDSNYEDNQDFDIELHLYDFSRDKSITETDAILEVNEGALRTVRMDLEVPSDLNLDREYVLFATADDNICNQDFLSIDIERPLELVAITDFDIPAEIVCGEISDAKIRIENLGKKDQDVSLSFENVDFDIFEETEIFELEKNGKDDRETREFVFVVPEEVESGEYEFIATIDGLETVSEIKNVKVECLDEVSFQQVEAAVPIKLKVGEVKQIGGLGAGIFIATLLLTTFVAISFLYFVYITRKEEFLGLYNFTVGKFKYYFGNAPI
jgi:hypothetical protein